MQHKHIVGKDAVKSLRDHVIQDYLRMSLSKSRFSENWVERYRELLVYESRDGQTHRTSYIEPLKTLVAKGEDEFCTGDMDVSIIQNLFSYPRNRDRLGLMQPSFPVNCYMRVITDDRNQLSAHSSSNESYSELLTNELIMLEHMRRFVQEVWGDRNYCLTDEDREEYRDRWEVQILDLMHDVRRQFETTEHERAVLKTIQDDIDWALNSKDSQGSFERLNDEYFQRRRGGMEDFTRQLLFHRLAAEAGFYASCYHLADLHYRGEEFLSIDRDLHLAAAYYMKQMRHTPSNRVVPIEAKCRLASLLINGYCEGHERSEGETLLEEVRRELPSTCRIEEHEVGGEIFYEVVHSPLTLEQKKQRDERLRAEQAEINTFSERIRSIRASDE